jgi:hypothetical protein
MLPELSEWFLFINFNITKQELVMMDIVKIVRRIFTPIPPEYSGFPHRGRGWLDIPLCGKERGSMAINIKTN